MSVLNSVRESIGAPNQRLRSRYVTDGFLPKSALTQEVSGVVTPDDGRALSETEIKAIELNLHCRLVDDYQLRRLFETIKVHRRVIKEVLAMFRQESPLRRVSVADPITNSQLAFYRELASMEDSK